MSRHQYVRNMDLEEELYDYDDYEDEELSAEDQVKMKQATTAVREKVGNSLNGLTNKEIENLLWDSYYDVPGTVSTIIKKYGPPPAPKPPKVKGPPPAPSKSKHDKDKEYPVDAAAEIEKNFAKPSPDDIVFIAQGKSKGLGGRAKGKDGVNEVTEAVKTLSVEAQNNADIQRTAKTRKNLNVPEEYAKSKKKDNANFVVIGHVDAGKSTLMGRLLFEMGVVDDRTMRTYRKEAEKIGKSSFAFAWVLDQTSEERSRGVTIDIASNKFETPLCEFNILDAPGHKDFVPNMIAGAAQADFAVLVIDSTTGEFESGFGFRGQTKEHTLLARSMGIQRIIVAVNKMDTVDWSFDRFDEIRQQMSLFLTTAGFHAKNVSFVPCSGLTGDNVAKKAPSELIPWYDGRTLVEELEQSKPMARQIEKSFRLTINDVFRGGITHPVSISGRIESGSVQIGDVLLSMPTQEKVAVKAIEVDDAPVDWAVAGYNITLHLSGVELDHLRQGDILCDLKDPVPAISSFTMKVLAFESLTPMAVDVHRGRLNKSGKISRMVVTLDKATGNVIKKKPRHIPAGALAEIEVEIVDGTIPVEKGTRIVLRAEGTTVAAGLVETSRTSL